MVTRWDCGSSAPTFCASAVGVRVSSTPSSSSAGTSGSGPPTAGDTGEASGQPRHGVLVPAFTSTDGSNGAYAAGPAAAAALVNEARRVVRSEVRLHGNGISS